MIGHLHHIAYAVRDIRAYFENFLRPVFSTVEIGEIYDDPIQKVRVAFVSVGRGPLIELVEPVGERSPVLQFVGSARGGLYHVCYEVQDLDEELRRLRRQRCLPLSKPVPAVAFGGQRIVFLMTPQRDLIELVEASPRRPQIGDVFV